MKITEEYLESVKSPRGGYTRAILAKLGVSWPPVKGWRRNLIGKELEEVLSLPEPQKPPKTKMQGPEAIRFCPNCGCYLAGLNR